MNPKTATNSTSSPIARPLFIPFTSFELDMLTFDQIQAHIARYELIIDWLKCAAFTADSAEITQDIDEQVNLLCLIVFSLESWSYHLMQATAQPARMAA